MFNKYGIKGHIWKVHGEGINHSPYSGKPPWNKGLTKETDSRVLQGSLSLKNNGKNGWNKGLTKETSQRIRNVVKGMIASNKVGGYHKNLGKGKQGEYNGIWCDSSWELAFVIYHLEHNIPFSRNWKRFPYYFDNRNHTYSPDFQYPDGTYIEVKGYLDERSKAKAEQFKHKLKILQAEEMKPYLDYVIKKYGKNFTILYNYH